MVVTANDGAEGLKKAVAELPRLIISDVMMPDMDGVEMCNEIKKKSELILTPFIFLTALTDDYKVLYAMSSGANQYVSKPIRFEYLLAIANQILHKKAT